MDLVLCRSLLDNALLAGQQLVVAHILNWHYEAADDAPRILPGVLSQCIAMLATYAEEKVVLDAFAVCVWRDIDNFLKVFSYVANMV